MSLDNLTPCHRDDEQMLLSGRVYAHKLVIAALLIAAGALTGCGGPDLEERLSDDSLMADYVTAARSQTGTSVAGDELEMHARRVCRNLADGVVATELLAREVHTLGEPPSTVVLTAAQAAAHLCPEYENLLTAG